MRIDNPTEIGFTIDANGAIPTVGTKGYRLVSRTMTILGWTVVADVAGSIVIDVKKCAFGSFPTTASMCNGNYPTLTSEQTHQSTDVSGWTTATITANDVVEFYVNSATTVTRVTLTLKVMIAN